VKVQDVNVHMNGQRTGRQGIKRLRSGSGRVVGKGLRADAAEGLLAGLPAFPGGGGGMVNSEE
jgi:hypothetical protein